MNDDWTKLLKGKWVRTKINLSDRPAQPQKMDEQTREIHSALAQAAFKQTIDLVLGRKH